MKCIIYTPDEAFGKLDSIDGSVIISGVLEEASSADKAFFLELFNVNENELTKTFSRYFHWFNIIHELCHIIAIKNGVICDDLLATEWMVNRIASAFWRSFGNHDVYKKQLSAVKKAKDNMKNPIPDGISFEDFYSRYSEMPDETMSLYAYFQFTLVERALMLNESIYDVLDEYGLNVLHNDIQETLSQCNQDSDPQQIVNSACEVFRKMGLNIPSVAVIYCNNPNVQCAPK